MNSILRYTSTTLFALLLVFGAVSANAQEVEAGRFDNGKMFTLDDPPMEYFSERYDFEPDATWFQHAQLGALRFATYCSASFVSGDGLILTNHHCARQSVTQVSVEDGVDYNEDGFYAMTLEEERPIEDLFVEQLITIVDVSGEVNGAAIGVQGDAARQQARQEAITAVQDRMTEQYGEGHRVQVVTLYAGGQHKAYVYKRFDDIRLVFAPETQIGYFGGDPDNFTYPRYSLDFSIFRAYDEDGEPLQVNHYFQWNPEGTEEGDLVFVIGNPGSTTRLQTVAELEYRRDFTEVAILNALASREEVYGAFVDNNPDHPATPELTDTYFSLANSRKAYTGRVEGLQDPYIIARRRDAQENFQEALAADENLQREYGGVIDAIAANREGAGDLGPMYSAFVGFSSGSSLTSTVVARSILAYQYMNAEDDESRAGLREQLVGMEDQPLDLQRGLLTVRLTDFLDYLGRDSEIVQAAMGAMSPEDAASQIMENSALTTADGTAELLDSGDLSSDAGVALVQGILPSFIQFQQAYGAANAEVSELSSNLARARFEVYGTSIPPDATFTLRLSDGVVQGYEYNGTIAPPHTTFYGLYDRHYSHGSEAENGSWALPRYWRQVPVGLDLSTKYNLVSTNDIIGGNSGSPLLDRNLNLVGIAFDGNIQSLPGNYIYLDEFNRTVSVDVRGMLAALEHVYTMQHIATELRNGGMQDTE